MNMNDHILFFFSLYFCFKVPDKEERTHRSRTLIFFRPKGGRATKGVGQPESVCMNKREVSEIP